MFSYQPQEAKAALVPCAVLGQVSRSALMLRALGSLLEETQTGVSLCAYVAFALKIPSTYFILLRLFLLRTLFSSSAAKRWCLSLLKTKPVPA